jgi:hypothetical protein
VGRASKVASSQAGKGLLTQDDLDGYKTRELAPAECDYRGGVLMTLDGLLSASTTPSYPAKAGYPVRRGFSAYRCCL